MMKKLLINILYLILTVTISFFLYVFYDIYTTENPFNDYYFKNANLNLKSTEKVIIIDTLTLDSLMKNPSSKINVITYYCGYSQKMILNDSSSINKNQKKTIFISVDNLIDIPKIDTLLKKNKFVDKIYIVNSNQWQGMYYKRGEKIISKYYDIQKVPNILGIWSFIAFSNIPYPYSLYTNEIGKVDSLSFGYLKK